jgi:DNA-binding CsgD family transcriptional regulator
MQLWTDTRRGIAACLLDGQTDQQAAWAMGLSYTSIRRHLRTMQQHYGVTRRAELVERIKIDDKLSPGRLECMRLCAQLTPMQRDAMIHLAKGYSGRESARMLGVHIKTLEGVRHRAYEVLGVSSGYEAAGMVGKGGLI